MDEIHKVLVVSPNEALVFLPPPISGPIMIQEFIDFSSYLGDAGEQW